MSYSILILRRAQKELAQLPDAAYERAKNAIRRLAQNPRPHGSRKLSGRDGWRIRVGDYRIIYETGLWRICFCGRQRPKNPLPGAADGRISPKKQALGDTNPAKTRHNQFSPDSSISRIRGSPRLSASNMGWS